ncbi:MAG TPA: hypothetical protein VG711_10065 [Phycisphaerales bacterium]|nr:hypothetical protein [Phycisphaerales bacterium]
MSTNSPAPFSSNQPAPETEQYDNKKGCLLLLAIALGTIILVVGSIIIWGKPVK